MHPPSLSRLLRLGGCLALILAGWCTPLAAAKKEVPSDQPNTGPLTVEELFRPFSLGQASLSPNGRQLGAIVRDKDDTQSLLFLDLETRKSEALKATDGLDVSSFRWVSDREVLFKEAAPAG